MKVLRTLFKHCMNNPSNSTDQALNQLVTDCQLVMHNTVILTNKNQELKVVNQKQQQKKSKTQSYIATEESLTDAEGIYFTQITEKIKKVISESSFTSVQTYAPPKCSLYSSYEHTAHTCSTKYLTTEP